MEKIGDVLPQVAPIMKPTAERPLGSIADPIERERRRWITEQQQRESGALVKLMLVVVPRKFHNERLSTFRPQNETHEEALTLTRAWTDRAAAGEPAMLAILGDTGTGKSHLLYGAAWELLQRTYSIPLCVRWYRFPNELRYGRGPRDEGGERKVRSWEVREEWERAPVCLIDEVRPTSGTVFDATEIAMYVMGAYDDEKALLITCSRGKLEDLIGDEPADRFTQVTMVGDSYRGVG